MNFSNCFLLPFSNRCALHPFRLRIIGFSIVSPREIIQTVSSWRKQVYSNLKYFWVLRTSYCILVENVLPLRNFCNISGFRNINLPSSYIESSPRNMYTSLFLCLVILYPSIVILLSCHILFWNFGLFIYLQQHLYIYKNPLLKLT